MRYLALCVRQMESGVCLINAKVKPNKNYIIHIIDTLNFDHYILASKDEASDKNISPTTETNLSSGTSSGCGNLIAYLVAPLVAVSFALLGNILVMVICKLPLLLVAAITKPNYSNRFFEKKKKNVSHCNFCDSGCHTYNVFHNTL